MKKKLLFIPMAGLLVLSGLFFKKFDLTGISLHEDTEANDELFLNADIKYMNDINPASNDAETPIGIQATEVVDNKISIRFIGAIKVEDTNNDGVISRAELEDISAVWHRGMFNKANNLIKSYAEKPSQTAYTGLNAGGTTYTVADYNANHGTDYTHFVTYVLKNIPYEDYKYSYLDVYLNYNGEDTRGLLISIDRGVYMSYVPQNDGYYGVIKQNTSNTCESFKMSNYGDFGGARGVATLNNVDGLLIFRKENGRMIREGTLSGSNFATRRAEGNYGEIGFTGLTPDMYSLVVRKYGNNRYIDISFYDKPHANGYEKEKAVTYGMYPKTRISNSTLISTLNNLTADSNGWKYYKGNYYVRAKAASGTSGRTFDDGTTINSGTNYWFKCEPIEWRIIYSDDSEITMMTDKLIDARQFNSFDNDYYEDGNRICPSNWKRSDMRAWLNDEFYNTAFHYDDLYINEMTVLNSDIAYWNQHACEDTVDRVALPSSDNLLDYIYDAQTDELIHSKRGAYPTDYAKAMGIDIHENNCGYYWTRTPDRNFHYNMWAASSDSIIDINVTSTNLGVRPMITIKKNTQLLGSTNKPTFYTENSQEYCTFGYYPQSVIPVDDALHTTLTNNKSSLAKVGDWYSYNGNYYVSLGLREGSLYPNMRNRKFSDGSYIDPENYTPPRWIKCDPIKWIVLEKTDTEALLMAYDILDYQPYDDPNGVASSRTIDNHTVYRSSYEYSYIRRWLNTNFALNAFNGGTSYLKPTLVSSSVPEGNYTGQDTYDRVFLLSVDDLRNTAYGFTDNFNNGNWSGANTDKFVGKNSVIRSDYVLSRGIPVSYLGHHSYALRPTWPANNYYDNIPQGDDGKITYINTAGYSTDEPMMNCIRPAIRIYNFN